MHILRMLYMQNDVTIFLKYVRQIDPKSQLWRFYDKTLQKICTALLLHSTFLRKEVSCYFILSKLLQEKSADWWHSVRIRGMSIQITHSTLTMTSATVRLLWWITTAWRWPSWRIVWSRNSRRRGPTRVSSVATRRRTVPNPSASRCHARCWRQWSPTGWPPSGNRLNLSRLEKINLLKMTDHGHRVKINSC